MPAIQRGVKIKQKFEVSDFRIGTIKFWRDKNGYGFIRLSETSNTDVYVHISGQRTLAVQNGKLVPQLYPEADWVVPKKGDTVVYVLEEADSGLRALVWCTLDEWNAAKQKLNSLKQMAVFAHVREEGPPHADNTSKRFVSPVRRYFELVWKGFDTREVALAQLQYQNQKESQFLKNGWSRSIKYEWFEVTGNESLIPVVRS